MFLNGLSYQEKKMFLDLSIHIAKANDVLSGEEKALISAYCSEMQMPAIELYDTEAIETVIAYFAMAEESVKKIVILEILGLAYVDGAYDETEEKLVKRVAEEIGIDDKTYKKLHKAIQDYYQTINKLAEMVK